LAEQPGDLVVTDHLAALAPHVNGVWWVSLGQPRWLAARRNWWSLMHGSSHS
jgi:hypothetical protein